MTIGKTIKFKQLLKRIIAIFAVILFVVCGFVVYANWKIPHDTRSFVYNDIDSVPSLNTALVLGASPFLRGGYENPYFANRIKAAKELYDAGKVKTFVLSGDNMHRSYNEPQAMRKALIKAGVPDSVLYLDYAGFRTLDSVVRMHKIFGQDSFIIVSQQFHNERAIFLAQYFGLTAYGYNAHDLPLNRTSSRTKVREYFARVKVFVDMIIGKQPKFLGDPIEIK